MNISLNTANLNAMNISSPELPVWQHLEDHWNKTQLHKLADVPTVPVAYLYQHMFDNNRPILPFQYSWWINRWYSIHLYTIFSHRDLCYGYRMANTSRFRDILLLLFLLLTCHASRLTCLIRFYMIYYCGWCCRGSNHLQKWWQGWTACYKTSWESLPALEMGTYMDGESTEATSTVESSS